MDESELKQISRVIEANRRRLEQIQDQISRLEMVQAEHADVETSLLTMSEKNEGNMIPIGAGVQLPITTNNTAVVDVGSGIFAEKSMTDTAEIIRTRITDIGVLIAELNNEAKGTTEKISELTTTLNTSLTKQHEQTQSKESEPQSTHKDTKRRGRGFGGELTLDD